MACNGCGSSSCRGCKDIKVVLPAGVGIDTITDNGDGTWTILYTDSTTQIINTPGSIPNDVWVELDETDMIAINYTGTANYSPASHGVFEIDLRYKILNEDSICVQGRLKRTVDILSSIDTFGCNFSFAPFGSSSWFAGTKILATPVSNLDFRVPVTIYVISGSNQYNYCGNLIYQQNLAGNNLISMGNSITGIHNGTHTFYSQFEFIAEIA